MRQQFELDGIHFDQKRQKKRRSDTKYMGIEGEQVAFTRPAGETSQVKLKLFVNR